MFKLLGMIFRGAKCLGNGVATTLVVVVNLLGCITRLSGGKESKEARSSRRDEEVNDAGGKNANDSDSSGVKKVIKFTALSGIVSIVSSIALKLVGFTTAGIRIGSIAAGIQSGIGNVAAGSLFSFLQSFTAVSGGATLMAVGVLITGASWGLKKCLELVNTRKN